MEISPRLEFSFEQVIKTHRRFDNKCFHSEEDLKELLMGEARRGITSSDENFIDWCVKKTETVINPLLQVEEFNVDVFYQSMSDRSNSMTLKRSLPFPLMPVEIIDSANRDTRDDVIKLLSISSMMSQSFNQVIAEFGQYLVKFYIGLSKRRDELTNDDYLFYPDLSAEVKAEIALDGPNRKKYIKKGSSLHQSKSTKYNGYCLSPFVDVSDIENISFYFSQRKIKQSTGDFLNDMDLLSNLDGPGLQYAKFCQSIYREVNINAMRQDRRNNYVFKPTGCDGVYILIYPGTKLRSGEMPNIAWFKIIVDNEKLNDDQFGSHWIFKKVYRDVKVSYSDWLSVDVHRLDHYIRCYDKILMAYYSVVVQKYKSATDLSKFSQSIDEKEERPIFSLLQEVMKDTSNTLGLIILIYLEDKRSTSKMLQNIRYLVMTSISLTPKYSSVFEKMSDPIRSPLQLFLLRKAIVYYEKMKKWDLPNSIKFGSVKYDHKSHTFLDSLGGSVIMLPHPIVSSPSGTADFSQILSEMYFTMLFNKNQDDPTHASFQILDKIIEGEENFQSVKQQGNHLGYKTGMSDIEFANMIVDRPKNHQFSRKAIEIGSKLLRTHLGDEVGDHFVVAAEKGNMNKTLDEYATFKSSAMRSRNIFDPNQKIQNPRRRCLEGVLSLLEEGVYTSYQVVDKYKEEETYYHVFKKNQIGGVREILILPITNRIRINVLETFSRNLCQFDRREALTHGSTKNDSLKAMLYNSKKLSGLRAPMHLTFDKSKWGPSFVPIQFIYLFSIFKDKIPGLFSFFVDLLIRHQNKECLLPERLTKAWHNDSHDEHSKSYPQLRPLKLKFLKDFKLSMKNESNMGQGILHYTSSLLHLCLISFRDEIYKRLCQKMNYNHEDHEDILSSDDSYTIFCPELYKNNTATFVKHKLTLFLKAQRIAELLFNCRTSNVKSSVNPFVGEFNSLFISNMTFMPTLFKFCLSSVHPVNTDSFFRMVKESYGASRQIVENGGGLDLYTISALCNKRYCESVYHVNTGGVNNYKNFGLSHIPYHLGVFPIFNPALMVIFGPEYYNYKMFKTQWNEMNSASKKLFMSAHKMIKGDLINTLSEYEDGDTVLGGLVRIEASIGPVKQLERIKKNAPLNDEQLGQIIEDDPLMILRRASDLESVRFKTVHKLYTVGSKEALKNIASSIFYGRVSASVSANSFYVPGVKMEKTTFANCLRRMIVEETEIVNLEDQIRFIYPKYVDYNIFIKNDEFGMSFHARNPFEIQTVQKLVTHKINTKLVFSVTDLLAYKWEGKPIPDGISNKVQRDFYIIQKFYPMIKDTMEETLAQFSIMDLKDRVKALLLLVLKLFSLREREFKGVIFGMGSQELTRSYEALLTRNFSNPISGEMSANKQLYRLGSSFDKIFCAYNHTILSEFSESKVDSNMWEDVSEEELIAFFQDPGITRLTKKRIFMVAISNGFMNKIEEWSDRVYTIIHVWDLRQIRKEDGTYYGDCDLTLFMGHKQLNVVYKHKRDKYFLKKMHINDPETLYQFLEEAASILQIDITKLISKCGKGSWTLQNEKVLPTTDLGFAMEELKEKYEIDLQNCSLEINDERTLLNHPQGYTIYSTDTGLLPCVFEPTDNYDFQVMGLSFVKMCKLGAFTVDFNILFKGRSQCLEVLDDINVPRPEVTQMTKSRLGLGENWHLRILDETDEPVQLIDATPDFMDSFMNSMMNVEIEAEEIEKLIGSSLSDMDRVVDFLLKSDVIFSMKTEQRIHQSRKLFIKIKNLKYDLICRMILLDMKINKLTMGQLRGSFKGESLTNVMFATISFYDRVYQTETARSPPGIILNIDDGFLHKFGIRHDILSLDL